MNRPLFYNPKFRTQYGIEVRRMRENMDITQEELGKRIGCTPSYVSSIELGRTEQPGKEIKEKLDRMIEKYGGYQMFTW